MSFSCLILIATCLKVVCRRTRTRTQTQTRTRSPSQQFTTTEHKLHADAYF